jgi:hypothetical protein
MILDLLEMLPRMILNLLKWLPFLIPDFLRWLPSVSLKLLSRLPRLILDLLERLPRMIFNLLGWSFRLPRRILHLLRWLPRVSLKLLRRLPRLIQQLLETKGDAGSSKDHDNLCGDGSENAPIEVDSSKYGKEVSRSYSGTRPKAASATGPKVSVAGGDRTRRDRKEVLKNRYTAPEDKKKDYMDIEAERLKQQLLASSMCVQKPKTKPPTRSVPEGSVQAAQVESPSLILSPCFHILSLSTADILPLSTATSRTLQTVPSCVQCTLQIHVDFLVITISLGKHGDVCVVLVVVSASQQLD